MEFRLPINDKKDKAEVRGKDDIGKEEINSISLIPPTPKASPDDLVGWGEQAIVYKPLVTITTKFLGDKIEISIADNGSGIPESIKDKIFQPFFTTKPTGQGTGLGLSLAYDIIKAHGGEIKVESMQNEGTSFIITLPIQIN
jgi:signal transduction histidine kinase